jgi:hypothetical protein
MHHCRPHWPDRGIVGDASAQQVGGAHRLPPERPRLDLVCMTARAPTAARRAPVSLEHGALARLAGFRVTAGNALDTPWQPALSG